MSVNSKTSRLLNGVCHNTDHFTHHGDSFYLNLLYKFNLPGKNRTDLFQRFSLDKLLCVLFLTCFSLLIKNVSAQTPTLDSLKKVLPLLKHTGIYQNISRQILLCFIQSRH
jgi:hypothetical protein